MKVSAAEALAKSVKNPTIDKILPNPLERRAVRNVSEAVKRTALKQKVTRSS
jgi:malic enzyme